MNSVNPEHHQAISDLAGSVLQLRPLLENIQVVLFDLDDTLIDTFNTSYALVAKSAEYFSLPVPTYERYRDNYGVSFAHMVKGWFPNREVDANVFRAQFEKFALDVDTPVLFQVSSVFTALKQAGYLVGIVTNSGAERTQLKLGHARLEFEALDCVVTHTDTGGVLKPHPAGILLAIERLRIDDPAKVIYVGNAYEDQLAAHAAGAAFCAVNQAENWENKIHEKSYFLQNAGDIIQLLSPVNPRLALG